MKNFKVHPFKTRLSKRNTCTIAALSLVISMLLLLTAQSVFLPDRQQRTISLRPAAPEEEGVAEVVWLASMKTDGDQVNLYNLCAVENSGWEYIDEYDDYKTTTLTEGPNTLSFDVYCETIEFTFVSGEGCGRVIISDGITSKTVDLRTEGTVTLEIARSYSSFERIFKNIVLFCLLGIIFSLLFVWIRKVGGNEAEDSDYLWFCILWGAVVIWRTGLLSRVFLPYLIYNDTKSYLNYPWQALLNLRVESGRVPVYPAFLEICKLFFGEARRLYAVAQIQSIFSLLSIVILYDLLVQITKRKKMSALLSFAYGMNLDVVIWDYAILTESLSLTLTILYIDQIVHYIQRPCYHRGVCLVALSLVMVFLRPTFLLFAAVLFFVWILRYFLFPAERKILMRLCCVSLVSFVFIGLYAVSFEKYFGFYNISDALPRQNIVSSIRRGTYLESDNAEFISIIEANEGEVKDGWSSVKPLYEALGTKEAGEFAKETLFSNIPQYVEDTIELAAQDAGSPFTNAYVQSTQSWSKSSVSLDVILALAHVFQFPVGLIYFIFIGQTWLFVRKFIREKSLPWIDFGLWGFCLVIPISTYMATCAEFPRTMIHLLPFCYCVIASIFMEANVKYTSQALDP